MMTDVMQQNGDQAGAGAPGLPAAPLDGRTGPAPLDGQAGAAPLDGRTGAAEPTAAAEIVAIRERIDEIDQALIALWQERARLSQQVGRTRMASGGTRLVLSREQAILERFRTALGADGVQLALLLLRAGRGPL